MNWVNRILSVIGLWALTAFSFWCGSTFSTAVSFVLAARNTYVQFSHSQHSEYQQRKSRNERILEWTFGRFTWLAMYGPILLLVGIAAAAELAPTRISYGLRIGGVFVFLAFGLYLCYLVAKGKKDPTIGETDG